MKSEQIIKIWIDNSNRLCIQPQTATFSQIYRSAMGVYWNVSERFLYPRLIGSWSSIEWFRQIISAVETEYAYHLYITSETKSENIDESLKLSIEMKNDKHNSI